MDKNYGYMNTPEAKEDPSYLGVVQAVEKETPKAILVRITLEGRQVERWIPKSVIHDDSEVWKLGHFGKLYVEQWWAEKNQA